MRKARWDHRSTHMGIDRIGDIMDNKNMPYLVHESIIARMERTIERLWILCILLIVLLVGTNVAWIYYEKQFEDTVITQEVDTGNGDANVTGIGDIFNGESKTDSQNKKP